MKIQMLVGMLQFSIKDGKRVLRPREKSDIYLNTIVRKQNPNIKYIVIQSI
jgi:hypothetical protein